MTAGNETLLRGKLLGGSIGMDWANADEASGDTGFCQRDECVCDESCEAFGATFLSLFPA